jgi:hypothetical protein
LTSEELILLLDSLQTRLPKCANQVLLRLVAKCITGGTNEVDISAADLARDLGIAEDSVKVAKRALAGILGTRGGARISTTWILPADWFVVQRSLFAVHSPSGEAVNWPGNQGSVPWKPGQLLPQKPGQTALETRATATVTRAGWTSFQGSTATETRAESPENGQLDPSAALETRAPSIDRDRALSSVEGVLHLRDSIEGVNWLPEELRTDGQTIKRWLRFYFAQTRPQLPVPDGPDEIIQAQCLAISEITRLQMVLRKLEKSHTKCGDSWKWFVATFCQRIHGTKDTKSVRAPIGFRREKKNPSSDGGAEFQRDLLRETSAAVGRM